MINYLFKIPYRKFQKVSVLAQTSEYTILAVVLITSQHLTNISYQRIKLSLASFSAIMEF